jgi:hypothetical protein
MRLSFRFGIGTKERVVAYFLAAALALPIAPASAAGKKKSPPARIAIEYKAAVKGEHRPIEETLKKHRVLEAAAQILSPVRLPRRLTLRILPCDGDANAYYENDAISICYEYFEAMLTRFAEMDVPKGATRRNLIIGAAADVLFHEFGHAVFDMLEIPVLGREEDAADHFSAYVLLNFIRGDARPLIFGAASWFVQEHKLSPPPGLEDYADEHGLPAQRFFNYICLAYGANPKLFAAALDQGKLPKARAERCEGEYRQMERAIRRLILPYVDRQALARVRAKRWFELDAVE